MSEVFYSYFAAEKSESLLFIAIALVALAAGVVFFFQSHQVLRGAAYPLVVIALIQLTVGSTVYFRTDGQLVELEKIRSQDTKAFKTSETARMENVNRAFDLYKIVEITLGLTGLGLILWGHVKENPFLSGLGYGLLIQSLFMLGMDLAAEKRADLYTAWLRLL